MNYKQRAETVLARLNQLAAISEDSTGISRTFGTEAFQRGSQLIQTWMRDTGLQTRVDAIGNVRGRLISPEAGAKTLVIASHMDTVVNAGKFDGPMGILMGLDLLQQLMQSERSLPFHLELIAFCDEEGVRFHTTYLGSNVVAGSFEPALLMKQDDAGKTLAEVIQAMGGQVDQLPADAIVPDDWLGYVEMHIEQGPVLYERKVPVAVVTAIAGQKRVELRFKGLAGHAGTVPMGIRQDALCAAADVILAIEQLALAQQAQLVATVGKLTVVNAASNVIPGEVVCSLDLRSHEANILAAAYQYLREMATAVGQKRKITVDWRLIQETEPVPCDPALTNQLERAITGSGYELIRLVSGAGHDAVAIASVAPVAMLFVRCFEGISHNPLEQVEIPDMAAALRVMDLFFNLMVDG